MFFKTFEFQFFHNRAGFVVMTNPAVFVFLFFVIPFSALFHRLISISSPSPFNRAFASLLYLLIRIYLL